MSEATARALSINRKKRGVVRASITHLEIQRLTTRHAAEFKVHFNWQDGRSYLLSVLAQILGYIRLPLNVSNMWMMVLLLSLTLSSTFLVMLLLQQYEEQLTKFKSGNSSVHTSLLSYDIEDISESGKGCSLLINSRNFCILLPHPLLHRLLHLTPVVSNFLSWM